MNAGVYYILFIIEHFTSNPLEFCNILKLLWHVKCFMIISFFLFYLKLLIYIIYYRRLESFMLFMTKWFNFFSTNLANEKLLVIFTQQNEVFTLIYKTARFMSILPCIYFYLMQKDSYWFIVWIKIGICIIYFHLFIISVKGENTCF